jgi:Rps23 Pro-64 3,4-dihydroxylase Tpa1-like proline 4-hydroxylase
MSFDYKVLDLGLVYYENVIPNPQSIIDTVNDIDARFLANEHKNSYTDVQTWVPWTYEHLHFNDQKFFPEPVMLNPQDYYYNEMLEITTQMYSSLDAAFNHYSTVLYPFAGENIKNREESINLLRYGTTGHLPAHQDQGVSSRVLSSVMYLNDNYDGGEIEFVNSNVKLKPSAGSIIFFPSNFLYIHEVHAINSGFRYSMPHWYHNIRDMRDSTGEV